MEQKDESENTKVIRFIVDDDRAVVPTKAYPSDIGYDLTTVSVFKRVSNTVILFDTGIRVSPPDGYYLEIIPRSSLSSTGYMLANSVGIIDPSFLGTLKIALIKVDKEQEDIKLPFTKCQLVLRKAEYAEMVQVYNKFEETARGDGGFGSSDKEGKRR